MNTGQPAQGQANAGQEDYMDKGSSLHAFCASRVSRSYSCLLLHFEKTHLPVELLCISKVSCAS